MVFVVAARLVVSLCAVQNALGADDDGRDPNPQAGQGSQEPEVLEPPLFARHCAQVRGEDIKCIVKEHPEQLGDCGRYTEYCEKLDEVTKKSCCRKQVDETSVGEKWVPRLKPWGDVLWTGEYRETHAGVFGDVKGYTVVKDASFQAQSPATLLSSNNKMMNFEDFKKWMKYDNEVAKRAGSEQLFSTVPRDLFGEWESPWTGESDWYNLADPGAGMATERAKADWEAAELVDSLWTTFRDDLSKDFVHVARDAVNTFVNKIAEFVKSQNEGSENVVPGYCPYCRFRLSQSVLGSIESEKKQQAYREYVICEFFMPSFLWTRFGTNHSPEFGGLLKFSEAPYTYEDFATETVLQMHKDFEKDPEGTYEKVSAELASGKPLAKGYLARMAESIDTYDKFWNGRHDESNNMRILVGALYKIPMSKWLKGVLRQVYCHAPADAVRSWLNRETLTEIYGSLLLSNAFLEETDVHNEICKSKEVHLNLMESENDFRPQRNLDAVSAQFIDWDAPHFFWTGTGNPSWHGVGGASAPLKAPFQALREGIFASNKFLTPVMEKDLRPEMKKFERDAVVSWMDESAKHKGDTEQRASEDKQLKWEGSHFFWKSACKWYTRDEGLRRLHGCMVSGKKGPVAKSGKCAKGLPIRYPGKYVTNVASLLQTGWLQLFGVSGTTTDIMRFLTLIVKGGYEKRKRFVLIGRVALAIFYMSFRQHSFMEVMLAMDYPLMDEVGIQEEYGLRKTMECVNSLWKPYWSGIREYQRGKHVAQERGSSWITVVPSDAKTHSDAKTTAAKIIAQCMRNPQRRETQGKDYLVKNTATDEEFLVKGVYSSDDVRKLRSAFLQSFSAGLGYLSGAEDGTSFIWYMGGVVVVGLVILATIGAVNPKGRKEAANNSGDDDQAEDWKDSGDEVSGKQALLEAM